MNYCNIDTLYDADLLCFINDGLVNKNHDNFTSILLYLLVNRFHDVELTRFILSCKPKFILSCKPKFTLFNPNGILDCIVMRNNLVPFIDYGIITPDTIMPSITGPMPVIVRAALSNGNTFHDLVLAGANIWTTYGNRSVAHYVESVQCDLSITKKIIESGLIIPPCRIGKFQNITEQITMLYHFI
jgi:hypothetical protein